MIDSNKCILNSELARSWPDIDFVSKIVYDLLSTYLISENALRAILCPLKLYLTISTIYSNFFRRVLLVCEVIFSTFCSTDVAHIHVYNFVSVFK